jgi:putative drug exporter of the RND superfamily
LIADEVAWRQRSFVDATIGRMVLVPPLMQRFGRANWWIPRWLDTRIPGLDIAPPTPHSNPHSRAATSSPRSVEAKRV